MAENTPFGIIGFDFSQFTFNKPTLEDNELSIITDFEPSGKYKGSEGVFELKLIFSCSFENGSQKFISGVLYAEFKFQEPIPFNEIPKYFYVNSIAIMFPIIRSFIATLTLQSNSGLVLLPILNLSHLENDLRNSTVEIV